VYIPLPNGLHFEWTLKALAKGKHVLLEKPTTSNSEEVEMLFRSPLLSGPKPLVLLEASHYRFHPAWPVFLSLLDQPNITHAKAWIAAPSMMFDKNDIRFQYDLAGGAVMDMAHYPMSAIREVFGAEPLECERCDLKVMDPPNELCDYEFDTAFRFPNGGIGEAEGSLLAPLKDVVSQPPYITVTHREVPVPDDSLPAGQEKTRTRKVIFSNFTIPSPWHRILVEDEFVVRKTDSGTVVKKWKTKEIKKAYTYREAGIDRPSEKYWLTYRYQLEEFVNHIRGREGSGLWISPEDSILQMNMVDMAYNKSGLPLRKTSQYRPETSA
jgi:predicted dehydrogenase